MQAVFLHASTALLIAGTGPASAYSGYYMRAALSDSLPRARPPPPCSALPAAVLDRPQPARTAQSILFGRCAGKVCSLESDYQLEAAFEAGIELVCVKFQRRGCAACDRTVRLYEDCAAEFPHALFLTVDCLKFKSFAMSHGIKKVPTMHIYHHGKLQREMNPLTLDHFPDFVRAVEQCVSPADVKTHMEGEGGPPVIAPIMRRWRSWRRSVRRERLRQFGGL